MDRVTTNTSFQESLSEALSRGISKPQDRVPVELLAFVRFALGITVAAWGAKYLSNATWFHIYVEPTFLFKYPGFQWVRLWPGDGIYWHFVAIIGFGLGLSIGFLTRIAAVFLGLSVAYVLMVEAQVYVNHFYLLACLCGLMAFLPAGRAYSVDAWIGRKWRSSFGRAGNVRSSRNSENQYAESERLRIYRWHIWLLRFQLALPYVFGAIAKCNLDWLRGQPMGLLLLNRDELPVVGTWLDEPWSVMAFAYGGLLFDLLVVPMLLCRRTRLFAVVWATMFHLTNAVLLDIGVFPWFMLATLVVFFPVDTLPRLMVALRGLLSGPSAQLQASGGRTASVPRSRFPNRLGIGLASVYVLVQLALPLRPWFVGGDPSWHECGHRYAWRMMLRNKRCLLHYLVIDRDTQAFLYLPANNVMTAYQQRRAQQSPELIRQAAVQLAADAARRGAPNTEVYALALVSLNGRAPVPMVDPDVDLTRQPPATASASWIRSDPGPFLSPIWLTPREQWWSVLDLPDRFANLQGKTPQQLQSFLRDLAERE